MTVRVIIVPVLGALSDLTHSSIVLDHPFAWVGRERVVRLAVASIVFCGASFGIVDEDDDGEQPSLQRFEAIDGATKEESEDAFLSEFTNVLRDGLSVKKVRPPHTELMAPP